MTWGYSHATVSRRAPEAFGMCDRCGFVFQHSHLSWQFDYAGPRLQNKRILVCDNGCLDVPQEQLRTIVIPADPIPIMNARQDPNMYMGQSSALSAIVISSEHVVPTPAYIAAGNQGYPPTPSLTFDSASASGVAFFNSGMTVINHSSAASGAKVTAAKPSGTWYLEYNLAALDIPGGSGLRCGVDLDSDSYATALSTASNGTFVDNTGVIWSLGANSGYSIGMLQQGDYLAVAVNSDLSLGWFRKTPGGYWNGNISADPAVNTGGVAISAGGGGSSPLLSDDGSPILSGDGSPVLASGGGGGGLKPVLADDGSPLLAADGSPILAGDSGSGGGFKPVLGDDGLPLLADDGSPILASDSGDGGGGGGGGDGVEPMVLFGGTDGTMSNAWTINTDAALFAGAMPRGFVAWSATAVSTGTVILSDTGSQILSDTGSPVLASS